MDFFLLRVHSFNSQLLFNKKISVLVKLCIVVKEHSHHSPNVFSSVVPQKKSKFPLSSTNLQSKFPLSSTTLQSRFPQSSSELLADPKISSSTFLPLSFSASLSLSLLLPLLAGDRLRLLLPLLLLLRLLLSVVKQKPWKR